jgi:hypothetical protein
MPRRNQRDPEPAPLAITPADVPPRTFPRGVKPAPKPPTRQELARIAEDEAVAAQHVCVWPTCERRTTHMNGKLLALCVSHAWDVYAAVQDDVDNQPKISEHQLNRLIEGRQRRVREDEARESRAIEPGWVYYVRITDRIKVGYSTDVRQRMRAYPPHAQLLAIHPGTPTLERQVHADLKGHLAQGREWFRPDPEVMAHIDRVLADFGPVPESFRYTFRDGSSAQVKPHRRARRTYGP